MKNLCIKENVCIKRSHIFKSERQGRQVLLNGLSCGEEQTLLRPQKTNLPLRSPLFLSSCQPPPPKDVRVEPPKWAEEGEAQMSITQPFLSFSYSFLPLPSPFKIIAICCSLLNERGASYSIFSHGAT